MKETKEMMIRLPMVTATSWEELNKARTYPQSGRYIVKMDNGDIAVADVTLRPVGQGEARAIDEETQAVSYCFVGMPEILDPDEWVLAIDLENARLAYEAGRKQMEEQMREANDCHEAEMADQKAKCEAACHETGVNCKKLIDEKEAELQRRMDALYGESEKNYQLRKMELEHEYEKKWMQLELDTPKRFAQGEWVSGKTLTEIIRTLTAGKQGGLSNERLYQIHRPAAERGDTRMGTHLWLSSSKNVPAGGEVLLLQPRAFPQRQLHRHRRQCTVAIL